MSSSASLFEIIPAHKSSDSVHEPGEIHIFNPEGKCSLRWRCTDASAVHFSITPMQCVTPFPPVSLSYSSSLKFYHWSRAMLLGGGSPSLVPHQQNLSMSEIDVWCAQDSWHFTKCIWSQARQTLGAVCWVHLLPLHNLWAGGVWPSFVSARGWHSGLWRMEL